MGEYVVGAEVDAVSFAVGVGPQPVLGDADGDVASEFDAVGMLLDALQRPAFALCRGRYRRASARSPSTGPGPGSTPMRISSSW